MGRHLLGIVVIAALSLAVLCAPASAATRNVKPGQSIQKAINKSKRGDIVSLKKGSYRESIQINRSITLKGHGSVLLQPKHPAKTVCNSFGPPTGICATGKLKFGAGPPKIVAKVRNIKVEGLTVRGFDEDGLFGFGTRKLRVLRSRFIGNGEYGLFSNSSIGTRIADSVAMGSDEAGFYIGDSQPAHAIVRGNTSTGNGFGILLRDASGGVVKNNTFSGNCVGAFLLADHPGKARGWNLLGNHVEHNNRKCSGGDEGEVSGIGILLSGARGTAVADNIVRRNRPLHKSETQGGIVIAKGDGGTTPRNDQIVGNRALHNGPADIRWDRSGSVFFAQNDCRQSIPKGICT